MRISARLALAALAASVLLAAGVSTASAGRLSVSSQSFRVTWRTLEFITPESVLAQCPVTLEGSFHSRTFAKVARTLVGAITAGRTKREACTNGIIAIFNGVESYNGTVPQNSLPWHVTYESFAGTLPNIDAVRFLLSRFLIGIRENVGWCTGRFGTTEDNITLSAAREAGGGITLLTPLEGRDIATLLRRDAGFVCPATGRIRGEGTFTVLASTARVTVTLI